MRSIMKSGHGALAALWLPVLIALVVALPGPLGTHRPAFAGVGATAGVRMVHASPDTPAVDVAVTGGAVLVPGLPPDTASGYLAVPAGAYDLEVRPAGTTTAALKLPGVMLTAGKIYTVFAEGLSTGTPPLGAMIAVDDAREAS